MRDLMKNLKTRLAWCLAVVALLASHAAFAAPIYRVILDTRSFTGEALLDLTFLANTGAAPASATLANVSGAFGQVFDASPGVAGAMPGQVVLDNGDGGDWLTQFVQLGGLFSFDITFGGDFATTEGIDASLFAATLYNADLSGHIGEPGSLVEFALLPQVDGIPGTVAVTANGLASVAQVPEPSTLLLAVGGLVLLGWQRRRR